MTLDTTLCFREMWSKEATESIRLNCKASIIYTEAKQSFAAFVIQYKHKTQSSKKKRKTNGEPKFSRESTKVFYISFQTNKLKLGVRV